MENPMKFPEIEKLINGETFSLLGANEVMMEMCDRNIGFVKRDNNVYQYGDYFFNIGKRWTYAWHAGTIEHYKDWNLTSMPKFVAYSKALVINVMLITEIPGSWASFPVPCREGMTFDDKPVEGMKMKDIPLASRQKFFEEMDFTMENGSVNKAIIQRESFFGTLYYISSNQTLILSDWSNLDPLSNYEESKDSIRSSLRYWLEL